MTTGILVLTVFVATAVEMVEALTIVLAVGVSRGWRSALRGAASAGAILTLLVALFGTALAKIPLDPLRLVVGIALLVFGLQWLRKAVARAAGRRPPRDEAAGFDWLVGRLTGNHPDRRLDPVAFVAAFKGVFLEGLEAAIIAITFGVTARQLPAALTSAGAAVAFVAVLGTIVHRPLTRVPENLLKLGVGVLLSSFGTFWVVEGLGGEWPGSDFAVLYVAVAYSAATFLVVRLLARSTGGAISSATSVGTMQRGEPAAQVTEKQARGEGRSFSSATASRMHEPYPSRPDRAALVLLASLSLGALLAFVGLSVEVEAGTTMRQDVALLRRIHSTFPAQLEVPMQAVTALGYYSVVAVILLATAYLFFRKGLRLYVFLLVLSTSGDMILTTALKIFNHQPRPHLYHSPGYPTPSSYSFPSGHAAIAVGFWGLMCLLMAIELRGWRRWALIALGALLALLIGFSRVYLGVHYPSDVLGGYLLAACWAAAVGTLLILWCSLRKVRSGISG